MEGSQHSSIKFDFRCGFVVARVDVAEGPAGRHEQSYLKRIAEHCVRCNCSSILIEKYTPENFDVWKSLGIATELARMGHPNISIAVAERGAELPAKRKLDVAVGNGRRLHIRVFPDTATAEAWLITGEDEQAVQ